MALASVDTAPETATSDTTVLGVNDLRTVFFTGRGLIKAVDGVSFDLKSHEVLAIVGQAVCRKSMTALSVMRLISDPPGRIVGGRVMLGARDLLQLDEREMRRVRGNDISMIFQEPMTSL
ncbi:MAG: ABC transporter ATP-binding protein, partial [Methylobacteriaceae bacterium]|nr:ABC transporter ATP-binding protein [Methylobacteriaceae bacterium]